MIVLPEIIFDLRFTVGRARGILAKNDRLDAQLIAEYVSIMPTRVVQRAATAERLAEVVTMRRQLCDEHVTIENQAAHVEDAILRRLNKRRLARLKADIHLLDKRMAEIVALNGIRILNSAFSIPKFVQQCGCRHVSCAL